MIRISKNTENIVEGTVDRFYLVSYYGGDYFELLDDDTFMSREELTELRDLISKVLEETE